MCSISNGSRDNSSTRSHRVNHHSTAICYISRYNLISRPATVKHSIKGLFLSSRRTSLPLSYLFSLPGSRDNSSTRSQRISITRQPFVTSATITWYPGELQWNTLLTDISSHRGAQFSHWDMCSISNGSRDNSSKRSQRISLTGQPIITSAAITWYPGELQWNTLLIDCSSHLGAHFSHWDMCSVVKMFPEIIQVQGPSGFHYSPAICYISHYNLRSRRVTVKHSINR